MAIRVFSCKSCGHRTRFFSDTCGNCLFDKPTWQRAGFWGIAALLAVSSVGGANAVLAAL